MTVRRSTGFYRGQRLNSSSSGWCYVTTNSRRTGRARPGAGCTDLHRAAAAAWSQGPTRTRGRSGAPPQPRPGRHVQRQARPRNRFRRRTPRSARFAQRRHDVRLATIDPVAGTVSWPNGIDLDPDVLHGDRAAASGQEPLANPENLIRSFAACRPRLDHPQTRAPQPRTETATDRRILDTRVVGLPSLSVRSGTSSLFLGRRTCRRCPDRRSSGNVIDRGGVGLVWELVCLVVRSVVHPILRCCSRRSPC